LKASENPSSQTPLFPTPIEDNNIERSNNRLAANTNTLYDRFGNRVATKVNDLWQFVIYDAFGKLIAEYGGLNSTDEGGVKYVLSDWQGSVRASVSNSGYVKSRTDYQAFGEEIQTGVGLRTSAKGFGGGVNTRQGYGLTEKDDSTGLNHTWFRKNENRAGRWTSPDPYSGSASLGNPQSFNRYSYVENQPTNFVDPSGLNLEAPGSGGYCIRYHYSNGVIGFWGPWTCIGGGDGGGGGGGGTGRSGQQPKADDKPKKKKCKQSKTGGDVQDIKDKLEKAGLSPFVSNIQRSAEGVTFQITDRAGFIATLNANNNFRHDTPFGSAHASTVGANVATVRDFRSFTSGSDTLGTDSTGFTRSLQIDVGKEKGESNSALGYADLDCDNPAQDVVSFFGHGFKVLFGGGR
jgi:RHS repeat-associated protein